MFECSFQLFDKLNGFSKSIEFVNWMKCFMYLFTRSFLITCQFSCFHTLLVSFSLSLWSLVQSYSRWSIVWFPPSHRHYGDPIRLKQCRYALVLPWPVMIAANFSINLILVVSLSLMVWKNPFVVRSHWICHLAMLWSLTCWTISLLGILLKDMSSFLAASFASLSASSFP